MKGLNPLEEPGAAVGPLPESREALVDRVLSSHIFEKANRSRELFLFLCARALADPGAVVHEEEIGVSVFNRPPGYDTGQDTLVRVQVYQLRKKLQQYFSSEGRAEPVIIEVPKGTYTPVFCRRPLEEVPPPETEVLPGRRFRLPVTRRPVIYVLIAAALIAVAVGLVLTSVDSGGLNSAAGSRPMVEALWHQIFANGRPACVVLSDSALALFGGLIGRRVSLAEYRNKDFDRLANELVADPRERDIAKDLMTRYFTHLSDTHLAVAFQLLNGSQKVPTDIVFARDFAVNYLQTHNVILLGSRRTNPWVDLFESQLNFRTVDLEKPMNTYFQNYAPLRGESASYREEWGHRGYCRVAFIPNLTRTGNILLISGTDMASTESGGQFISSERWVQVLHSALRLSRRAPFPYFELLLKVDFVVPNAPAFEIVAFRIPKG